MYIWKGCMVLFQSFAVSEKWSKILQLQISGLVNCLWHNDLLFLFASWSLCCVTYTRCSVLYMCSVWWRAAGGSPALCPGLHPLQNPFFCDSFEPAVSRIRHIWHSASFNIVVVFKLLIWVLFIQSDVLSHFIALFLKSNMTFEFDPNMWCFISRWKILHVYIFLTFSFSTFIMSDSPLALTHEACYLMLFTMSCLCGRCDMPCWLRQSDNEIQHWATVKEATHIFIIPLIDFVGWAILTPVHTH